MNIDSVSTAILSTISAGVVNQLAEVKKRPFGSTSMQFVGKNFFRLSTNLVLMGWVNRFPATMSQAYCVIPKTCSFRFL